LAQSTSVGSTQITAMYYLISGPCKLCSAACEGISKICTESCKCCNGICAGIKNCWSDTFGDVYHKPIGGYVVFTWLFMIVVIAMGVVGYAEITCEKTEDNKNAKNMLIVAALFAVVHSACAYYIQRKILKNIVDAIDKEEDEKGAAGTPKDQRDYDITSDYRSRVRKAIWEVVKYDFLFLFYFIFCPASFACGIYGISLIPKCTDKESFAGTLSFGVLIFYNIGGILYFFALMCGIACGAGKDKVKTTAKKAKKAAGP